MVSNHLSEKGRGEEKGRKGEEKSHRDPTSRVRVRVDKRRTEQGGYTYGDQNNNVLYISPKIGNGPIVDLEYIYLRTYVYMYCIMQTPHGCFFWEGIDVMLENCGMVYCTYRYSAVRMFE